MASQIDAPSRWDGGGSVLRQASERTEKVSQRLFVRDLSHSSPYLQRVKRVLALLNPFDEQLAARRPILYTGLSIYGNDERMRAYAKRTCAFINAVYCQPSLHPSLVYGINFIAGKHWGWM